MASNQAAELAHHTLLCSNGSKGIILNIFKHFSVQSSQEFERGKTGRKIRTLEGEERSSRNELYRSLPESILYVLHTLNALELVEHQRACLTR